MNDQKTDLAALRAKVEAAEAAAFEADMVPAKGAELTGWLPLAGLVAAFDPEVVVVGGGVSAAGDRLLDPARAALRRSLVGGYFISANIMWLVWMSELSRW